jgi:hypothetical protein
MKNLELTHEQIIEKLSKLTFVKKDGNSLISHEGFTLRWDFEFRAWDGLPIQLLIRVLYENAVILTWGCTTLKDTEDFVNFIQLTELNYLNIKYNTTGIVEKAGQNKFNNL